MINVLIFKKKIVIESPTNNIQQVVKHKYEKEEMPSTVNNSSEDMKHLLGFLLNNISFYMCFSN